MTPDEIAAAAGVPMLTEEETERYLADVPEVPQIAVDNEGTKRLVQSFHLDDSPLAERIATGTLSGTLGIFDPELEGTPMRDYLLWTGDRAWMRWDGKVWAQVIDAEAIELVRVKLKALFTRLASHPDLRPEDVKRISVLLTKRKAADVTYFLRGLLAVGADKFDAHPDLINCQNGVVDLRNGEVRDHDRYLFFSKITPGDYLPDATHPDWDQALAAIPEDIQYWLQVRYGQAITGYPVDDDVLPVQSGGGSNGKSTIVNAVLSAVGGFGVVVPEKTLLANMGEHPTEVMVFRGARLAIIEETPEGKHLPTKRLKDLVGTPVMTGRYMHKDFVQWDATHSLFLNSNYVPQVTETDHGTWRRLALVKFPYKYVHPMDPLMADNERHGDPGLRDRLRFNTDDQLEAVLAWLIEGAQAWYAGDRSMVKTPLTVAVDTADWRAETDLIMAFCMEKVTFDPSSRVVSKELFECFTEWLQESGRQLWSEQTFASRFAAHELAEKNHVEKKRVDKPVGVVMRYPYSVPPTTKTTLWMGVKFS